MKYVVLVTWILFCHLILPAYFLDTWGWLLVHSTLFNWREPLHEFLMVGHINPIFSIKTYLYLHYVSTFGGLQTKSSFIWHQVLLPLFVAKEKFFVNLSKYLYNNLQAFLVSPLHLSFPHFHVDFLCFEFVLGDLFDYVIIIMFIFTWFALP